jgi:multidrug resistance efflux pump
MKSKKLIIGIIAVAIVAVGAFASLTLPGLFASTAEAQEVAPEPAALPAANTRIIVEGQLIPVQSAALSLSTVGRVAAVLVAEGATVEQGQVLVRLEAGRQQAGVAQAQANLDRATARLAELQAGALPEELASAQAAVDAAQARLDRLQGEQDIRGAEAAVANAQAALARLQEGTSGDQLTAARADLANAEAARNQAQAAYDKVAGLPDIGARPESLALQQATNAYNAVSARLADLQRGASPADVAGARARIAQAQAALDALKAARPADLAAGEAELRRSQAQADLIANGVRSETLAAAGAEVAAAEAALAQAQVALAEAELRAPFAGTVVQLNIAVGEQAAGPVLVLADLGNWRVETTDLTELHVVDVALGAAATVTFDALPEETFTGTVERIRALGQSQKGEISYTAVVKLDRADPRLRWNMTAAVEFAK